MYNVTILVSSLFFLTALICMLIGIYLLYININTIVNKLGFLCCTSLCCWCVGAGLSLMASNNLDSLIWKRFAAIGVGTFFSFFLHYIIVLTENESLLKKKWVLLTIYIPSMMIVYFFALSESITKQLYHLEKTPIGWISMTDFNLWIVIFDLYIISFMLIALYLVYQWKKNTNDKDKKKQANLILIACLISIILAIIAEFLDKFHLNSYVHDIVPLIQLIPMLNVVYAIKKHNFMKATLVNEDIVFMEQFRTKITKYLSGAFCAGGIIYFITQYMHDSNADFKKVILFTSVLFLFGLINYILQKYLVNEELKILFYSLLLSISIPVINIRYIHSAAITVWAFPFIIIIAALLFSNTTILIMVSTSMILTQLYLWINASNCEVVVDASDYFGRIGLMGLAICLIYYINNIYLLRLSELSEKIKTQDLLFLISSRVINVNNNNLTEKMDEVLNLLCKYINADRVHVRFQNPQDGVDDSVYYYWCNDKSILDDKVLKDTSITSCTWWRNQVKESGIVQIPDVSQLPRDAMHEKEILMSQNVKSMIAIPLNSHEHKIGFLRIDFVSNEKKWDNQFIKILTTVGNILGEVNIKTSSEKKMEQMVYYDQLTNIPNRQFFSERITQAIDTAGQNGDLFGVIFLNLDSFKNVNDTIGHHYGDKMLIMIADRLTKCLRKTDTVCRFGGDEFLIMLNDIISKKDIETVVAKIVNRLEKPLFIDEQEFYITASVGISVFPIDGIDNDTLIKNADIAMYKAKTNGKNQAVFCSEEMKEEIQQTMIVTNNLYHAQERSELEIVYQPQVSTESGKVIAMEALARWYHPELGIISPAFFIPIAEHTGLINSIGEWILRETCNQNKIWQEMGLPPVRLAVNVSVNQLLNSNFVNKVMRVLEETKLDPNYLELEITENIAIQESDYIIDVLSRLKELGISLAIDDFGIEYSSLSRIKSLPVDRLKIDMHFIKGILENEKDRVIVDVIIKLAKDLNLKVIAEGVEEVEQLNYLKEKKCDEVQGYYFYKPLSKKDMQEVLMNMR